MSEQVTIHKRLEYSQACQIAAFIVGYQRGAQDHMHVTTDVIAQCCSSFRAHGPLYYRVTLKCFTTWYNWCTMQGYGASSIIAENGMDRLA